MASRCNTWCWLASYWHFALTQAVIPRTKRGPYVSMPVNAGVGSVLLDKSISDTEDEAPTHDADGVAYAKPDAVAAKTTSDGLQAAFEPESSTQTKPESLETDATITTASGTNEPLEVVQAQTQQDLALPETPRPPAET